MTNVVPGQYRNVSIATVDIPLTAGALTDHFLGREVYRHTRFVVARDSAGGTALVERCRGGRVEPVGGGQVGVVVLRHVTRPGRRRGIGERAGRQPGGEGGPVVGGEPAHVAGLQLGVAARVGLQPSGEHGCVRG